MQEQTYDRKVKSLVTCYMLMLRTVMPLYLFPEVFSSELYNVIKPISAMACAC